MSDYLECPCCGEVGAYSDAKTEPVLEAIMIKEPTATSAFGDGRGYGYENGIGNGNGIGDGYGDGYGDGFGYGYGYGYGYEE